MAAVPKILFDTSELPVAERLDAWRTAMQEYELAFGEGSGEESFAIHADCWMLGDVVVTSTRLSPVEVIRPLEKIRADHFNHLSLLLVRDGTWAGDTDGREFTLGPGQLILFDLSRPFQLVGTGSNTATVTFARAAAHAAGLPEHLDVHGLKFEDVAARVLADHVMLLIRQLPTTDESDVGSAVKGTLGLLAACIAASPQVRAAELPERDIKIRHRVSRYIDQNLGVRDLTSQKIGKEVGVSRSGLYRAFEPLGGVAEYLRARRLEAAHVAIENSTTERGIIDIAHELGFASDAHFSRVFRERYGYSPGNARTRQAQGLRDMADLIDTHGKGEIFKAWIEKIAEPGSPRPQALSDLQI